MYSRWYVPFFFQKRLSVWLLYDHNSITLLTCCCAGGQRSAHGHDEDEEGRYLQEVSGRLQITFLKKVMSCQLILYTRQHQEQGKDGHYETRPL